jgi:hypothetical protein
MDTIVVVTGTLNGNDLTNEHQGDKWRVEDGVVVSYPAGEWFRVERRK